MLKPKNVEGCGCHVVFKTLKDEYSKNFEVEGVEGTLLTTNLMLLIVVHHLANLDKKRRNQSHISK